MKLGIIKKSYLKSKNSWGKSNMNKTDEINRMMERIGSLNKDLQTYRNMVRIKNDRISKLEKKLREHNISYLSTPTHD